MLNQVASSPSFSHAGVGGQRAGERSNYFLAPGYALAGISEKNIVLLGCFSLKLLITKSGGKRCIGRLQNDSALSRKPEVTSPMRLLSGEQRPSSANNAPSLDPVALLLAGLLRRECSSHCEHSFSRRLLINAAGMGGFSPPGGSLCTRFLAGETFQHNPKRWKEEKTAIMYTRTHTLIHKHTPKAEEKPRKSDLQH